MASMLEILRSRSNGANGADAAAGQNIAVNGSAAAKIKAFAAYGGATDGETAHVQGIVARLSQRASPASPYSPAT